MRFWDVVPELNAEDVWKIRLPAFHAHVPRPPASVRFAPAMSVPVIPSWALIVCVDGSPFASRPSCSTLFCAPESGCKYTIFPPLSCIEVMVLSIAKLDPGAIWKEPPPPMANLTDPYSLAKYSEPDVMCEMECVPGAAFPVPPDDPPKTSLEPSARVRLPVVIFTFNVVCVCVVVFVHPPVPSAPLPDWSVAQLNVAPL